VKYPTFIQNPGYTTPILAAVSLILLFNSFVPVIALSQDQTVTITGTVYQMKSGLPMMNVNVIVIGTHFGAATDINGDFIIRNVPAGHRIIEFSHVGYITRRYTRNLRPGTTAQYNVKMEDRPIILEEVEILSEYTPPEQRHRGDSQVVTRQQIRNSGVQNFSQLLRSFIPRANVIEDGFDLRITLTRQTSLTRRYHGGEQNPLIILNGMRLGNTLINLNGIINPRDIERVEVIHGPAAMMYGAEGSHGVIIIDTIEQKPESGGLSALTRILIVIGAGALLWFLI
jgi:TonB-dependent starch-binding outer membrane protein SusC